MFRKTTFFFVLFIVSCYNVFAQTTVVKGVVSDAKTHKELPYVTVFVSGANIGTSTDEKGNYYLSFEGKASSEIKVSYIGYASALVKIVVGSTQVIDIALRPDTRQLNEIVIKPKRTRYRNKDNPAVELIKEVIAHKSVNRTAQTQYVSFEKYEKIQFALSNSPEKLKKNFLVRKYGFIASSLDTVSVEGKALLPLFLQETLSDNYQRNDPAKTKSVIKAEQKVTFDPSVIDNNGITSYVKHICQDVDVYDNDINLLTNRFLSPVADLAPTFYRFYIVDTQIIAGHKVVQLAFGPRNTTDMLFQGIMFVALDNNYAIQNINLKVSKHINLNWVRSLDLHQEFNLEKSGSYHVEKSEIRADFGITKGGESGIYAKRSMSVKGYNIAPIPDSVFNGPDIEYAANAKKQDSAYWSVNRHDSLTRAEKTVYTNMDSLQHSASFKRIMNVGMLLFAGYTKASPYVEIGPVNTFYSFNPVEGFRLRIGGRTTPLLSKRLYGEAYVAYGFKDERWKYYLGGIYSFHNRSIYEFPVSMISANFQRDTKIPGQELQFVQEDNVLLSIKRGVNDKWLYNDIYNVNFLQEFRNHISIRLGYKNWQQSSAGGLHYVNDISPEPIASITTSELSAEFRWAPREEFYQGKLYRVPMPNQYPIFSFRAIAGVKGLLGGEYNYQNFSANIYKRVYLSQLGYTDIVLEGGYIRGKLPYPLLDIHRANQTYSYQLQSYNLMNFLEFVSDHYASLNLDHCFNGFFLNKMPLVKKLKFREFISLKMLYGGVRDENLPANSPDLLKFPTDERGSTTTYTLDKQPYIEGSIGVGNILKFFRVDLIRRFAYLNHPNVTEYGVRARFKFDF